MREIKFRGINNDGNWCFGDLIQSNNDHNVWIHAPKINHTYKVDPDTVGQFTGLKDADGLEIYEGDVLQKRDELAWRTVNKGVVFWHSDECRWCVKLRDGLVFSLTSRKATTWHVISNIHDNPELLRSRDFA